MRTHISRNEGEKGEFSENTERRSKYKCTIGIVVGVRMQFPKSCNRNRKRFDTTDVDISIISIDDGKPYVMLHATFYPALPP